MHHWAGAPQAKGRTSTYQPSDRRGHGCGAGMAGKGGVDPADTEAANSGLDFSIRQLSWYSA